MLELSHEHLAPRADVAPDIAAEQTHSSAPWTPALTATIDVSVATKRPGPRLEVETDTRRRPAVHPFEVGESVREEG